MGTSLIFLSALRHIVTGLVRGGREPWHGRPPRPQPRASFDDEMITVNYQSGTAHSIRWDQLTSVAVMSSDAGPIVEDVFLVLVDGETELLVPHTASGFSELLHRLQRLPSFDNDAVVEAMTSTSNRQFDCWKRSA